MIAVPMPGKKGRCRTLLVNTGYEMREKDSARGQRSGSESVKSGHTPCVPHVIRLT